MAKTCIECLKKHISVVEVGDVVVEKEECQNCNHKKAEEGDLRVWWSSQVPIDKSVETCPVENVEQAKAKINELTQRDLKDKSVIANVGGLEVFEGGEWCEWLDEESGNDIMEITRGAN